MRRASLAFLLFCLSACDPPPPKPLCPYNGPVTVEANAGCFVDRGGEILLIRQHDGLVTVPGGASESGEDAHCTAYRETWEETGISVIPGELITVFDNGFHLYQCELNTAIEPIPIPYKYEVEAVLWRRVDQFEGLNWRFPREPGFYTELLEGQP